MAVYFRCRMSEIEGTPRQSRTPRIAGLLLAAAFISFSIAGAGPESPSSPRAAPGENVRLFPVPDLNGQTVDLAPLIHGKVALIAMWASWCEGCIEEIPRLRELARSYRDHGLVVVGIGLTQGEETPAKQRHMAARQLVNYLLLFDAEREFQTAYSLRSLPFTLLVGADGKIRWQGAVLPGDLEARVQALLKEIPGGGGQGG